MNKADPKNGPESRFFHGLKGKRVRLVFHNQSVQEGVLVWVDRYTLGLRITNDHGEVAFYKSGIASVNAK